MGCPGQVVCLQVFIDFPQLFRGNSQSVVDDIKENPVIPLKDFDFDNSLSGGFLDGMVQAVLQNGLQNQMDNGLFQNAFLVFPVEDKGVGVA